MVARLRLGVIPAHRLRGLCVRSRLGAAGKPAALAVPRDCGHFPDAIRICARPTDCRKDGNADMTSEEYAHTCEGVAQERVTALIHDEDKAPARR
jgi:hypothetical protein